MKHKAHPKFWFHYRQLSSSARALADKNFELLQANPRHGSLQLKKVGRKMYSARIGLEHRALTFDLGTHLVGFWIGSLDEYERLIG